VAEEFRVELVQEGGFTGLRRVALLDTRSMPEADSEQLRGLIARAEFFNLKADACVPGVPDAITYTVTIEGDRGSHTVRTNVAERYPALDELVTYLRSRRKKA
jgi:hypothetical protein